MIKDVGRIIILIGVAIAFAQALWYADNKFDIVPLIPTFTIPVLILIMGGIILMYSTWRKQ